MLGRYPKIVKEVYQHIQGHEPVVELFGYWPTFHDSPISKSSLLEDTLSIELPYCELTKEVDSSGYYITKNHHTIGFEISGIRQSVNPISFSTDNGLFALLFEIHEGETIKVEFDSFMGPEFDGWLIADCVKVTKFESVDITNQSG